MRISNVSIHNYRGIKECNFPLSSFACIVGENNAGKSTILLALSLFISGTKLTQSEFYDTTKPILIEVTLEEITDNDISRISEEHRERIKEIILDNRLTLLRKYKTDGSSELLCKRLMPKDSRFDAENVNEQLKGKKGAEIREFLKSYLPECADKFDSITTQGSAKEVISQIIKEMQPEELDFKEAPLPTGISNSIKNFLPEPVLIPAVKDVTDEVKTKESATFGKLIGILLSIIESTKEVQDVIKSFEQLTTLLNRRVDQDGQIKDNRLEQVQYIEGLLNTYLKEGFPNVLLELVIPPPELKQVFSTAQILLDDGVKDSVDTKGDGLKRSVTFALLRSYVELKSKFKTNNAAQESYLNSSPYLFLFEEPELYLHPSAQHILFDALVKISEAHQVITTTHSPLFFSPTSIGTFIKVVKKYPEGAKPYGLPICIDLLRNITARDAFQLICFENNSAAFFAKKVVLVEGDSDLYFIKYLSKLLNDEWNFDTKNIPIVRISGKGNAKRYKEFFHAFDINVHVIVDLDALIGDFDKLGASDPIIKLRKELLDYIDEIAIAEDIDGMPNKNKIKEMVRRFTWRDRYEKLKAYARKVQSGYSLEEDEIYEIELLFSEEADIKRKQVLLDSKELPIKEELLRLLRKEKIYILSKGAVEDYYPEGVCGEDKPTKALHACKLLTSKEQVRDICPKVSHDGNDISEFEAIFSNIFN